MISGLQMMICLLNCDDKFSSEWLTTSARKKWFKSWSLKSLQIVSMYAGTKGHMDNLKVSAIGAFEPHMHSFVEAEGAGVLEDIMSTGELSDENAEKLGFGGGAALLGVVFNTLDSPDGVLTVEQVEVIPDAGYGMVYLELRSNSGRVRLAHPQGSKAEQRRDDCEQDACSKCVASNAIHVFHHFLSFSLSLSTGTRWAGRSAGR